MSSITQDTAAPLCLEGEGGEDRVERSDAVLTAIRNGDVRNNAGDGCWWWNNPSSRSGGRCSSGSRLGVQLEIAVNSLPLDPAETLLLSDTVI